jgi:hypothetical protein
MEKEFVPYELALRMKQLGFDEHCIDFATIEYENVIHCGIGFKIHRETDLPTKPFGVPTWQSAFRWFREKYRLKGEIDTADMIWSKWSFNIELKGSSYILYSGLTEKIYFNSYEEAQLECLEKLIEIVEGTKS